ncbi:HET-domain-containing protein [Pyrenochaeta sp. DS3sAY3a]|nr:HET-domain-containing protein [Pyrenochaeta sp. DS3sAY3a]
MRLINSATLALEEFMGQEIPEKFAILSHTWVTGQEVSYKEYLEGAHRDKSGYTKIVKACGLAKEQGIQYVWVDTCCIDKSSSAELSEAINSMYKWYEQSEVCYAFLSDLPRHGDLDYWLPRCRWFERGWTLQELIAPSYVIFFDAGYSIRGTKDSLQQILSEITNIDVDVLKGVRPISSYCIAAKMSWAHRRKTTRTEDIAYCLLGIFGLNMPLLYGEGKKAFRRLQEELIRTSVDMSIFAWCMPRPTGHNRLVIHPESSEKDIKSAVMLCGMLAESPSDKISTLEFACVKLATGSFCEKNPGLCRLLTSTC